MICRNCSAVITDDCEICPSCGHDPAKRGRNRKTALIITLLSLLIFSSCVMIAVQLNKNPPEAAAVGTSSRGSDTTAFFALKETSVPESSCAVDLSDESRPEASATVQTGSIPDFIVETFETSLTTDKVAAERALIKADKADFAENGKEYIDYICRHIIEKNRYAWLTIDFGDSTGIVFLSDNTGGADYGKIDENGLICELYGSFIISRESYYSYLSVFTPESASAAQTTQPSSTQPGTTKDTAPDTASGTEPATAADAFTTKAAEKTDKAEATPKNTSESPTETSSSAVREASDSVADSTVYITATGSKYHRADCSSLSHSKIQIDRNDAISEGYEPCKKCNQSAIPEKKSQVPSTSLRLFVLYSLCRAVISDITVVACTGGYPIRKEQ